VPPLVNYQTFTFIIPVVVHIIHNSTDAVGVGTNISLAQIQTQIDALNRDFNNRFTRPIPAAFNNVATSPNFRFVLAQKDPNGNSSTGVTRTSVVNNTTRVNWDAQIPNTDLIKKGIGNGGLGNEPWDTNRYLNIWVTNLQTKDINGNWVEGLVGYANFPSNPDKNRHGVVSM
jgi:hypothetical protein